MRVYVRVSTPSLCNSIKPLIRLVVLERINKKDAKVSLKRAAVAKPGQTRRTQDHG